MPRARPCSMGKSPAYICYGCSILECGLAPSTIGELPTGNFDVGFCMRLCENDRWPVVARPELTFRISHAQGARDGLCIVHKTQSNQIVITSRDKMTLMASISFGAPRIAITRFTL